LVALVGLGEGNHHNHHAFPRSAKHGLERGQIDPTWWLIWAMEKTGLAWDVQRATPEAMERKRVAKPTKFTHPDESPVAPIPDRGTAEVA
jgi:stearoyl-CoA desaturase (delta-9 desaturase)